MGGGKNAPTIRRLKAKKDGYYKYGETYQFDYPTVQEGLNIPVVYGRVWINGIIIQFGGQYTGLIIKTSVGQKIVVPFWMALCHGKITVQTYALGYGDNYQIYNNVHGNFPTLKDNFNDGTGSFYPIGMVDASRTALVYVNKLPGIAHQYFPVAETTRVFNSFDEGQTIDTFAAQVTRDLSGTGIPGANMDDSNNPVAVLYDLLTSEQYGCGVSTSRIDTASFHAAAQYMYAKKIGIATVINGGVEAREYIESLCSAAGMRLWVSREGVYKVRAYDPDHILNYDVAMASDDFIEFKLFRRQYAERANEFKFAKQVQNQSGRSPENVGKTEFIVISNDAAIASGQAKKVAEFDLSMLVGRIAGLRARQIVRDESYPMRSIECTVNMEFANLEPMDVVMVTNTEHDITNVPFRVIGVDYLDVGDNKVSVRMEEAMEIAQNPEFLSIPDINRLPQYSETTEKYTLYFTAFNNTSNAAPTTFSSPTNLVVQWTDGQTNVGTLTLDTDFIVISNNAIRLVEPKWTATVEANSLGLLSVSVWDGGA